jgi:hypothetical protein
VLVLGSGVDPDTESGIEWFKVAVGAVFLLMAFQQWKKRPRDGEAVEMPDTALAIAVYVVLGSITVAGSVLFYFLSPGRAARPLDAVGRFMSDNSAVIMMIVLLLLGAKLLGDGLGGLASV